MRRRLTLILLGLAAAAPTFAQVPVSAAASTAPDPSRLAAARQVIDQVMPPAQRDKMIETMVAPMMENMRRSMLAAPQFKAMFESEPRARQIFADFVDEQLHLAMEQMHESMPAMAEAMTRAYARRFTVAQLNDVHAFFTTPTGQAYLREAPTIMSDPDVAAWQSDQMNRTMGAMPDRVAALVSRLDALQPQGRKP